MLSSVEVTESVKNEPGDSKRSGICTWEFILFFLFFSSWATNLYPFVPDSVTFDRVGEGRSTEALTALVIGFYALLMFYGCVRLGYIARMSEAIRRNVFILALPLLVLYSTLWSDYPAITLGRALTGAGAFVIVSMYVATRRDPFIVIDHIYRSMFILLVISLIGVVVVPDLAIHTAPQFVGLWKGVFGHKNTTGSLSAMTAIMALMFLAYRKNFKFDIAALALSVMFLVTSESKTALFGIPAVFLLYACLLWASRSRLTYNAAALFVLAFVVSFGYIGVKYITPVYGIDFTGRTAIWQLNYDYGWSSPILGHGYKAVYGIPGGGIGQISLAWEGVAGHAHNAFLEVWSQLGAAGVSFVFLYVFLSMKAARELMNAEDHAIRLRARIGLFLMCFALNRCLLEPDLLNGVRINWLIVVCVLTMLPVARRGPVALAGRVVEGVRSGNVGLRRAQAGLSPAIGK